MDKKFLEWLCCGDVGISSKAIAFVMYGISPEIILRDSWTPYPHDSDDFGRCYELLKIFPEWRERIEEMKCLGKNWERIALAWRELEVLHEQESPKKLHERLEELSPIEDEENCDIVKLGNGVSIMTPKGDS